jgi:hypothetical protein
VREGKETSVQIVFPAHIKLKIAVIKVDQKLLGNMQIRNAIKIFTNIEELFRKFPT